jgi:hypothetical protein
VRAGFQYCLFLAQMVGEPAPTISKNITDIVGCVAIDNLETKSQISQIRSLPDEIYPWVRAGFQYCLFLAQMVGEPAPTISKNITDIVGCVAIDNLETKSQISQIRSLPDEIYRWVRAGFQYCLFLAQMVGEPAPTISK